jgi:HD-like signal output (HDOD) protein
LASAPAFPPIVMKLLAILADENSSLANVAACIATDPTFSGLVLKRANAADMVQQAPARDVRQALVTLGIERTRELTLTKAAIAYMGAALKTEQLRRCWRHMVACAMAAAEIARACKLDAAEPYTAGLLHDIGRLGLLTAYPRDYEQTMLHAHQHSIDLIDYERERFGVDHTEAGRWLATRWKLPETIAWVAGRHHDEPSGPVDLLVIVQMACRLADLLGYYATEPLKPPDFDSITAPLSERARKRLRARLPNLAADIAGRIDYFEYSEASNRVQPPEPAPETNEDDFTVELPASDSGQLDNPLSGFRWAVTAAMLIATLAAVALSLQRC